MGMFDSFENVMKCPYCGGETNGFQTKSFSCTMGIYDWDKIRGISFNAYTYCIHCDKWIEFMQNPEGNKKFLKVNIKKKSIKNE